MTTRTYVVVVSGLLSLGQAASASAQVRWGHDRVPQSGACFYESRDFHGQYFCVPRGAAYTSLPAGFNDTISSIRVFGSGVRIYRDRDFHGKSRQINRDVRDLHGSWGDVISSVQVR